MRDGDNYAELRDFMARNTTVSFNNYPLSFHSYLAASYPAGLREIINGQETGSILFCVTPDLESGLHLAEVNTRDLVGNVYSYTWAFEVDKGRENAS